MSLERTMPRAGGAADGGARPGWNIQLDDIRLDHCIAATGRAVVYRGHQAGLDRPVLVKVLQPAVLAGRPDTLDALCEDAYRASLIDHRNVARLLGVVHGPRATYVTSELVDGVDLATMLRRRHAVPARMVLRVVRDVAAGLLAATDHGLTHGAVTPSAILLTATGQTRVLDLGLRAIAADGSGPDHDRDQLDWLGYAAPEHDHLTGRSPFAEPSTDVFALGATAYHAVTGARPFPTDNRDHALDEKRAGHALAPSLFVDGLDARVDGLLEWMMQPEPARRPSYLDIVRACQDIDLAAVIDS